MAAASKESSLERLRAAIQLAIDEFKTETSKIGKMSTRRGAVADLLTIFIPTGRA